MKKVVASCWMEAKACFARDFLVVLLSGVSVFFQIFTDFPFHSEAPEIHSPGSEFYMILMSWCIFLAIFCRTVLRDLDDRAYFNQHPLSYKHHYIGKCVYITLVITVLGSFELIFSLLHAIYYSSSLASTNGSGIFYEVLINFAMSFFTAALILFVSLYRPLHYALLIGIVSMAFYAVKTWPDWEGYIPGVTMEPSEVISYLSFGLIICWLGMMLFERKMIQVSRANKVFLAVQRGWMNKLYVFKWVPVVITVLAIGATVYIVKNLTEVKTSPFDEAVDELMGSIQYIKHQKSNHTDSYAIGNI